MRLSKSIDELYDEVKGYDLVMCNDAPLALALNNRLDQPRVGVFASTPRELAGDISLDVMGDGLKSDIELIKTVSSETGYRMRYVHGEIENIKKIRRYTSNVKKHLSRRARNIFDSYIRLPSLDVVMDSFDGSESNLFKGKKIAVINGELYDDLDKHFNPKFGTYDEISAFKRGKYEIPEIRELGNDRQIAENAVSLITEDNAADVAIVMDVKSPIADAVRSALYRKRLPFINSLNMRDLSHIRDFLEFLNLSLSFSIIRVKQVRELVSAYGGWIQSRYDEYLVAQYLVISSDSDRTKKILETMRDIESMKFIDVCETVVEEGPGRNQVKILLKELNITDSIVNRKDTDDTVYAVNNIGSLKHSEQIPAYEKEGVLLVDCQNSVYIDRPVVIYLGLGPEWEKDLSELNSIDYKLKDEENDKNLEKFQILLQQGTSRVYICNSAKKGRTSKPCTMFNQCSDEDTTIESFGDVCQEIIIGPWKSTIATDAIERGTAAIDPIEYVPKPFSKSSYDNFVSCPREFMYSLLLGSPDKSHTVLGSYVHEYAEFKICYPEKAKENNLDYYVDIIADKCMGLYPPETRSMIRCNIRTSINNIDKLVEEMNLSKGVVNDKPKKEPNTFFTLSGVTNGSSSTEIKILSGKSHMEGTLDYIMGNWIIDFKTGNPKVANEVLGDMNTNKKKKYNFEFQAMFYLSLIDEISSVNEKTFSLFFTIGNQSKDLKNIPYSIKNNLVNVHLIDSKYDYFENEFMDNLVETKTYSSSLCVCRKRLIDAVKSVGLEDPDKLVSDTSLKDMIKSGMKYKKEREAVDWALTKISETFPNNEYFVPKIGRELKKNTLYVTRKALDDFRKKVWDDYLLSKIYYSSKFPATPLIDCRKCNFYDICTANPVEGGEEDVESE